jgi:hypothetical protein
VGFVHAGGNAKLVETLKSSDKKDRLRVDFKRDLQGDTLKVTSIELLQFRGDILSDFRLFPLPLVQSSHSNGA